MADKNTLVLTIGIKHSGFSTMCGSVPIGKVSNWG
jgi:hypothetical protein